MPQQQLTRCKRRVTVGAVMVLLAGLSLSDTMFAGSAVLGSYSFLLCSLAIVVSGATRSKAMLLCLFLSVVVAGPVRIFAGGQGQALGKTIMIPILGKTVTVTFVGGLFFFLLAFAAGWIFRSGKTGAGADASEEMQN